MPRFETLHQPAATLDASRKASLRAQILDLNLSLSTHEAFVGNWRARIDGFFDTTDLLHLAWQGESLVGHLGERVLPLAGPPTFYIDSFTVAPQLQTSGLGRRLAARAILHRQLETRGRGFLHVSRTSNPHVAAGVWRGLEDPRFFYPSFDPARPSDPRMTDTANQVANYLWPELPFDPATGVLAGAYGGEFIPVPPTRHEDVAGHFAAHVDAARGDAIVQVVRYTPATWLRLGTYFARHRLRRRRR